jgi:hypothetical protein
VPAKVNNYWTVKLITAIYTSVPTEVNNWTVKLITAIYTSVPAEQLASEQLASNVNNWPVMLISI